MVIGKVKTIYKFYKLVFGREDGGLGWFNRETRN